LVVVEEAERRRESISVNDLECKELDSLVERIERTSNKDSRESQSMMEWCRSVDCC